MDSTTSKKVKELKMVDKRSVRTARRGPQKIPVSLLERSKLLNRGNRRGRRYM